MDLVIGSRMIVIRIIPYPPSFNRMAANTMEPAIGASTCALGSHRWRPYSGILTMKAIMHASHRRFDDQERASGLVQYCIIIILSEPREFCSEMRTINRGRDPISV